MCQKTIYVLNEIIFPVSKFLIATGDDGSYSETIEIIDLSISGNYQCPFWVNYPIAIHGAIGGLLEGIPVICGGTNLAYTSNICYKIKSKKTYEIVAMSTTRSNAAGVVINGSTLWITGGKDHNANVFWSSEFIQLNETMPGPNLPIPLVGHTMVNIDNDLTMFIGGGFTKLDK